MGLFDRLLGRERFSQQWSVGDPAFAAWWFGTDSASESVTPYTVMGLSGVIRSVQIISTSIAGLPLRTYERQGDEREQIPSVFDDPYPGEDGLTPFAWTETVLMHLLLWREAVLWHEPRADGSPGVAYRPIIPDAFEIKRVNGKRVFRYTDPETGSPREVGSERITYIPGPSLDATKGHPLLHGARAIFSAAISGDKTAQRVLRRGIRLAGLVTPADGTEPFDEAEGKAMLEGLRSTMMGSDNAGDIAILNRHLKLERWQSTNVEAQWAETRKMVLGEIERLFGVPPHLLADTEKQTSWGTGVAEQNLSLARYTLRGWSDRIEQVLTRKVPRDQFLEFDYKGLLQGTPEQEIKLLIAQVEAGLLTADEARRILNRPPLQRAEELSQKIADLGGLIRAGFDPTDSARKLGLPAIKHLGLAPVTVRSLEESKPTSSNGKTPAAELVPGEVAND